MAVPDSSPRAFAAVSVGTRKGWCFLMGFSSLLDVVTFRGGMLGDPQV
jgi:hypothetical protein